MQAYSCKKIKILMEANIPLKKVIIEIETDRPESVEIYMKEVLNGLLKNKFFPMNKFTIRISEEV